MTASCLGIRELEIRYKPGCLVLPVSGDVTTPRAAATLAAAVLADLTVEQVIALHVDTKRHVIGVHVVGRHPGRGACPSAGRLQGRAADECRRADPRA
jgi:hypothetical protein